MQLKLRKHPNAYTVLRRSIAPRFLAYRQNSRLSRFPPLKIPRYTAKLSYRHPPQVFRHKSRKTNLNSPVSTAHNYLLTAVYWSVIMECQNWSSDPKLTTTNCDNLTIKWDLPITPHMKMNCCCHVFIMTMIMLMSRATNDGSRICQHWQRSANCTGHFRCEYNYSNLFIY